MNPALELVSVTAGYGDVRSCASSPPACRPARITTLIGGNGAGKSTLLRAIYGTNRLFSGQIVFKGETIERLPPWERLKRGVGFVPQGRCNFPAMSVAENLKMGCYTLPGACTTPRSTASPALFPMLRQKWRTDAGNLSGGEQQILEMAMVLLVEPSLLLLDEPSLGLSPKMQGDVFTTVQRIAASGVTVLVVEQNVRGALLISDRALVMEQGRLFMEGPADEVRTDPRIKPGLSRRQHSADSGIGQMEKARLAVDIGGTFTDLALEWDGKRDEREGADHAARARGRRADRRRARS